MLMRFSVSNYMSFGYKTDSNGEVIPTDYYLYAGNAEQHNDRVINFRKRRVLKFSSIYGANASGKSNLIKAMDAGKQIILRTMDGLKFEQEFCRNKKTNVDKPTQFEYEFTIGDKCYAYGFTVNLEKQIVLSEWLYEMEDKKEHVIFERLVTEQRYYFDENLFHDEEQLLQFHFFIKDANRINTTLLLHEIKRRGIKEDEYKVFNQIYQWFRDKLVIIYPNTLIGESYTWFGNDDQRLMDILRYFDTGITEYSMRKINETAFREYFNNDIMADKCLEELEKRKANGRGKGVFKINGTLLKVSYEKNKEPDIKKLMFRHGDDQYDYEYGEESDGTQRLIELLDVILNDSKDKVFVIDELDRSFHPQMTIKFVETFLKFSAEKTAQLIITTHESNLMDLKILRRDEIWFAEKELDNSTKLYPLEMFKIRYDKVVSKNYLAGRYGAVPVFKDFEYVWGKE